MAFHIYLLMFNYIIHFSNNTAKVYIFIHFDCVIQKSIYLFIFLLWAFCVLCSVWNVTDLNTELSLTLLLSIALSITIVLCLRGSSKFWRSLVHQLLFTTMFTLSSAGSNSNDTNYVRNKHFSTSWPPTIN